MSEELAEYTKRYPEFQEIRDYAAEVHKDQTRKDGKTPYMNHIDGVIINVIKAIVSMCRIGSSTALRSHEIPLVLCLAAVHDMIEDQADNCSVNHVVDILVRYGRHEHVPMFVTSWYNLTKLKAAPDYDYVGYLLRIKADKLAKIVKIADLTHNMSDLKNTSSLYEKYALTYYVLETDG